MAYGQPCINVPSPIPPTVFLQVCPDILLQPEALGYYLTIKDIKEYARKYGYDPTKESDEILKGLDKINAALQADGNYAFATFYENGDNERVVYVCVSKRNTRNPWRWNKNMAAKKAKLRVFLGKDEDSSWIPV